MSAVFHLKAGAGVCAYRETTDRITSNMNGVRTTPARAKCICCGKQRTYETGKDTRNGFVCNFCGRVPK